MTGDAAVDLVDDLTKLADDVSHEHELTTVDTFNQADNCSMNVPMVSIISGAGGAPSALAGL